MVSHFRYEHFLGSGTRKFLAMARSGPKLLHIRCLFLRYLEPLDVIDRFHGTHIFEEGVESVDITP